MRPSEIDRPFWRFVSWLAYGSTRFEPMPAPGMAWCRYCSLNEGRTLEMPAGELTGHLHTHIAAPPPYRSVRVVSCG